jgi:type I restriction enzyme M protein
VLDARSIYRKVTRKIYDFSPQQMQNLAAIVWLYRGQRERFLTLVKDYLDRVCMESDVVPTVLASCEATLADLRARFDRLTTAVAKYCQIDLEKKEPFADAARELGEVTALYEIDQEKLLINLGDFRKKYADAFPNDNDEQHAARAAFAPIAQAIRGLIKQLDLIYKLAARTSDLGAELSAYGTVSAIYDRRAAAKSLKQLDEQRRAAIAQLRQTVYFHRLASWLQDRFPKAELQAVPGLVKLVDQTEIEAADWSLTPGRYVGVAPQEEDEEFDFEQVLRDIHIELSDLNADAAELAETIQRNFEELGV